MTYLSVKAQSSSVLALFGEVRWVLVVHAHHVDRLYAGRLGRVDDMRTRVEQLKPGARSLDRRVRAICICD